MNAKLPVILILVAGIPPNTPTLKVSEAGHLPCGYYIHHAHRQNDSDRDLVSDAPRKKKHPPSPHPTAAKKPQASDGDLFCHRAVGIDLSLSWLGSAPGPVNCAAEREARSECHASLTEFFRLGFSAWTLTVETRMTVRVRVGVETYGKQARLERADVSMGGPGCSGRYWLCSSWRGCLCKEICLYM